MQFQNNTLNPSVILISVSKKYSFFLISIIFLSNIDSQQRYLIDLMPSIISVDKEILLSFYWSIKIKHFYIIKTIIML